MTALYPEDIVEDEDVDPLEAMERMARDCGLRRIHVLTWRDIEHPAAGGSELHINEVARVWAAAGLDVRIRTGDVPGRDSVVERDGYQVLRRGGRLSVLLRAPGALAGRRLPPGEAVVEVWHGVNFMAPLWARGPAVGVVHHVHGPQFHEVLPRGVSDIAAFAERRIYPRLYRRMPLVALSGSTKREMVQLGLPAENISVVEPGVSERFSPSGSRAAEPTVLAVARFMPQKRVPQLVDILAAVRTRVPSLRAVIVGDGPDRGSVEERIRAVDGTSWIHLAGRVSDDELVEHYRRAWVVASASTTEGWGLTLTEAAACGTPSVASRILGHEDAVVDDVSGILASDDDAFVEGLTRVLRDDSLRTRLADGAETRVRHLRWPETARRILGVLTAQIDARPEGEQ